MARRAAWRKAPPAMIGDRLSELASPMSSSSGNRRTRHDIGPDLLHRLDPLAHQLEAGFEGRAVILDFLGVPAAANAKEEAPARNLIDRGNELCGLDRVALHDEAHARSGLQGLGHRCRRAEHAERIHDLAIGLGDLAAARKGCPPRYWDVRMRCIARPGDVEGL